MMNGRLVFRALWLAIAAMLLGMLCTIIWLAVYAAVIAPGHEFAFYEDYAARSAPMIAIVTGIPVLFGAGWFMARGLAAGEGARAGLLVGIACVAIDLLLLFALTREGGLPWDTLALSYGTKIVAAAAGGWLATRGAPQDAGESPA